MAPTNFVDGTFLTPAFCNTLYNTNGGHVHDGVSGDGHSTKIDLTSQATGNINLTSQVVGALPDANIAGMGSSKLIGSVSLKTQANGTMVDISGSGWTKGVLPGSATLSLTVAKAVTMGSIIILHLEVNYSSASGSPTEILLTPPTGYVPVLTDFDSSPRTIFYSNQDPLKPVWCTVNSGQIALQYYDMSTVLTSGNFSGTVIYSLI